jgi:DNA-binding NarL/FixJ family response regulator
MSMAAEIAAVPLLNRWSKVTELAQRHYVTSQTVIAACKENGVELPRRLSATTRSVIELLRQGHIEIEIARQVLLSSQRVREIREAANNYGLLDE